MFKWFYKRAPSSGLLESALYYEVSFYHQFVRNLKCAKNTIVIESPYLSEKRTRGLIGAFKCLNNHGVKIRVNTRDPRHHNRLLKIQAWEANKMLRKCGVKVYICSDLRHRKLAIIDQRILWEGSLNILSQARSKEIMRRTVSANLCYQMTRFTGLNRKFW